MKKKLECIQENSYSCGSMCIKSVVLYYGGFVPDHVINRDLNLTIYGTNALLMVNTLVKYGFDSSGYKVSYDNLKMLKTPFIVHFRRNDYNHFVVVYKIKKNILVMDPSIGFIKLREEEFKKRYTGVIITCYKSSSIIKYKKNNDLFIMFNKFIKDNLIIILIYLIISIIIILIEFVLGYYLVINRNLKINILIIFIVLIFIKLALSFISSNICIKLIKKGELYLNKYLLNKIFNKSAKTYNKEKTGEIISKINNFKGIESILLRLILKEFINVFIILLTIILLFNINKIISYIYIIYLILYIIVNITLLKHNNYVFKLYKQDELRYNGLLSEYISSIFTIKSLKLEAKVLKILEKRFNIFIESSDKFISNSLTYEIIKKNLTSLFIIFINTFCLYLVKNKNLSFNMIVSINVLISYSTISIDSVLTYIRELYNSIYHIDDLSYFLNQDNTSKMIYNKSFINMKLKNFSYSYDNINIIVKIKDFEIKSGDKVFIKGCSGTGKSTLAKCISGIYDDYNGDILINDIPLKKINYLNNIVYTSLEDKLMFASIKDNILIGKNDKRLKQIIKTCNLENIINKKNMKLNELIKEGAPNISVGEKSRIILARALAFNPKILIIDELLSSVDNELEDELKDW